MAHMKKGMVDLGVTLYPLANLVEDKENTKLHPMPQVKQIMKSILEFGFVNPIIADKHTRKIIAGHGRYLAAVQLGITEVPVIFLAHLSPDQITALNIADNKLNMNTGFDMKMLEKQLKKISASGLDLTTTGFTLGELNTNFKLDLGDKKSKEEEAPPPNRAYWSSGTSIKFPSDNEYDIPVLDLEMQAHHVDNPVQIYGSVALNKLLGTTIFYSEDWRFEKCFDKFWELEDSGTTCIVEPNFTVISDSPKALAVWNTFRKRWLARYLQSRGIPVIVDTYTGRRWFDFNLLGVPKGWRAFATRSLDEDALLWVYNRCCEWSQVKSLEVFMIYGGGHKHAAIARKHGWTHILEHIQAAELMRGRDHESDRAIDVDDEEEEKPRRKKPRAEKPKRKREE